MSKEISDVDSNQFDDFAVGAPFDESAVVLRSRPVISFKHKVIFNFPKAIDPEVVEYTIKVKIDIDDWKPYSAEVFARLDLNYPNDRIQFNDPTPRFKIPINRKTHTEELTFRAKEQKFGIDPKDPNEPKPIVIDAKVQYEVDACPSGKSLLKCPMLSRSVGEHLEHINMKMDFKTGCEQPNKCKCGMKFSLKKPKSYDVKVGQQNSLDLEFEVKNEGSEPAYGVTIVFTSAVKFPMIHGPRGRCKPYNGTSDNGNMTECSLPKIAKLGKTQPSIRFHFPSDFKGKPNFNIFPVLKDPCNGVENSANLTNQQSRTFQLEFKTKIELTSSVSSSQIM